MEIYHSTFSGSTSRYCITILFRKIDFDAKKYFFEISPKLHLNFKISTCYSSPMFYTNILLHGTSFDSKSFLARNMALTIGFDSKSFLARNMALTIGFDSKSFLARNMALTIGFDSKSSFVGNMVLTIGILSGIEKQGLFFIFCAYTKFLKYFFIKKSCDKISQFSTKLHC